MTNKGSEYSPISPRNTPGLRGMTFREFQQRLRYNLCDRVRRGEITERGLARLAGISQPHVHHVLKGQRALSAEMADQILRRLRIDLLDLIEPGEILDWRRRAWK